MTKNRLNFQKDDEINELSYKKLSPDQINQKINEINLRYEKKN